MLESSRSSFNDAVINTTIMEVASPLAFGPATAGKKRSLACSPQLLTNSTNHGTNRGEMEIGDDYQQHSVKRRRFHGDTSVDSLSETFSAHAPFFANKSIFTAGTSNTRRRLLLILLLVLSALRSVECVSPFCFFLPTFVSQPDSFFLAMN